MKLFTYLLSAVIFSLPVDSALAQGLPVIDATAIVNQITQIQHMVSQLQSLENQLVQLRSTYGALTGNRGLGTVLNGVTEQQSRRYLPGDLQSLSELSGTPSSSPYSGIQSRIITLEAQMAGGPSGAHPNASPLNDQRAMVVARIATEQAIAEASYAAVSARIADTEDLIATIGTTTDPKGLGEIQGRIQAEQVLVANEQNRALALLYAQRAAQESREQQMEDALKGARSQTIQSVHF